MIFFCILFTRYETPLLYLALVFCCMVLYYRLGYTVAALLAYATVWDSMSYNKAMRRYSANQTYCIWCRTLYRPKIVIGNWGKFFFSSVHYYCQFVYWWLLCVLMLFLEASIWEFYFNRLCVLCWSCSEQRSKQQSLILQISNLKNLISKL